MRVQEGNPTAIPSSLTEQERQLGLEIVEQLGRFQDKLQKRRGGKCFSPSWEVIDEQRDSRTHDLNS
jgi:hypothetical protein